MKTNLTEKATFMLLEHVANVVENMDPSPKKEILQGRLGRFKSNLATDPRTKDMYRRFAEESQVNETTTI